MNKKLEDLFRKRAEQLVDRIRTTIDKTGNEVMIFEKSAVATLIHKSMEEGLKLADKEKETHNIKLNIKVDILSFVGGDYQMVDGSCADKAIEVVDGLSDKIIEKIYDYYPEGNGTISFQWANEQTGARLSLNVGNDTMSYYYKGGRMEKSNYIGHVPINDVSIRVLSVRILKLFPNL